LQQFPQYQEAKEWDGTIVFVPSQLTKPFFWKTPQLIFPSMSDPGHHNVVRDELDQIFALMAIASEHQFLILSKRPKAMKAYIDGLTSDRLAGASKYFWNKYSLPKRLWRPIALLKQYFDILEFPLKNVWVGTSVENQAVADRILDLRDTPARIRFVSCESLLERVDLRKYLGICVGCQSCEFRRDHRIAKPMVDWVIAGGESARKRSDARPCHLDWLRSIINVSSQKFRSVSSRLVQIRSATLNTSMELQ
jgi:protein gp37